MPRLGQGGRRGLAGHSARAARSLRLEMVLWGLSVLPDPSATDLSLRSGQGRQWAR